jgi:MFS transporter, PAT family, beta-lactamase induction signal transducer AmpG
VELASIGLLTLLATPWSLKLLWAPWVDRARQAPGGRQRVLVPLLLSLAGLCLLAAMAPLPQALSLLLVLILAMNLVAATQDIAVDGLAVELLPARELGLGNAAQVVGFKVGMLLGGGLLLCATQWIGYAGLFLVMGGLAALAAGAVLLSGEGEPVAEAPRGAREILARTWAALRLPGMGPALAFIATYKLGETLVDAMFKPFLVDQGHSSAQIGLWIGTWGLLFSIAGSLAGGLLASRISIRAALGLFLLRRLVPLVGTVALAVHGAPPWAVILVSCAENFVGGALTTATFAFMMSRVDRRIGGTHYTALATVEVLGKAPAGLLSGFLAQALGYPALFALGAALSLGVLPLWAALGPRPGPRAGAGAG